MATDAAPEQRLPPLPPRRLSEELADVRNRFAERPVTLREVIYTLRGRAYTLLLILLSLPVWLFRGRSFLAGSASPRFLETIISLSPLHSA